jgi:hypothetical protein
MPTAMRSALTKQPRQVTAAPFGDPLLGPLKQLPGTWLGVGHGWNMIALPFDSAGLNYRLLLNQYDEHLNFTFVDSKVPNRGISAGTHKQTDQSLVALDYEQVIHQVAVADQPPSNVTGSSGLAIHHEPGLFLQMTNQTDGDVDIARLATVPHGDAALALGSSSSVEHGVAPIPAVKGLPIGSGSTIDDPYLQPYRFFRDQPFKGTVTAQDFPGFNPVEPQRLLELANTGITAKQTTVLTLDTTTSTGGIHNAPFVVTHANAVAMKATFWIQELAEDTADGNPKLRLQYLQVVILEFAPRRDGMPGLIHWPHISINTLEKASDTVQAFKSGLTG